MEQAIADLNRWEEIYRENAILHSREGQEELSKTVNMNDFAEAKEKLAQAKLEEDLAEAIPKAIAILSQ